MSNSFPTKRDYYYGLGIIGTSVSTLIIGLFGDSTTLATKLNFTATVTSIILAVIAIIITLLEGAKNGQANDRIINSSKTLKKVTKKLNEATEGSSLKIDAATDNINKSIDLLKEISEKINNVEFIEEFRIIREGLQAHSEMLSTVSDKITEIPNSMLISQTHHSSSGSLTTSKLNDLLETNKDILNEFLSSVDFLKNKPLHYLLYFLDSIQGKTLDSSKDNSIVWSFLRNYLSNDSLLQKKEDFVLGVLTSAYMQLKSYNLVTIQDDSIKISSTLSSYIAIEEIDKEMIHNYIEQHFN